MLLFDMHADFFGRFVLRRNRYIRLRRAFRAESDSSTLEAFGGLRVIVFEARR